VHRQFVWVVSLALAGCGGEGRKKSPESVAPVTGESSGSAADTIVKQPPPTENACPVGGCPVCLPPRACTMANGCSGTQQICDGELTECALTSTSKRDCLECGSAGKQVCNLNGTFAACVSTTGRQCTGCGVAGTRTCQANGSWSSCDVGVLAFPCTACGYNGTQTCQGDSQYSACDISNNTCTTPACNKLMLDDALGVWIYPSGSPTCTGGALVCHFQPFGLQARGGTGALCTTACGSSGKANCGAGGDGLCRAAETCNNCDDDLNGLVDDAPGSGVPRSLTQNCSNSCGVAGQKTCAGGAWSACSQPDPVELCDGLDNNCDGRIDENDACRQAKSCP